MNTAELRAAAERRRSRAVRMIPIAYENEVDFADYKQRIEDANLLAEGYLAEHPADDDEPITNDWIMGFECVRLVQFQTKPTLHFWVEILNEFGDVLAVVYQLKTRRQLRHLLAALNKGK